VLIDLLELILQILFMVYVDFKFLIVIFAVNTLCLTIRIFMHLSNLVSNALWTYESALWGRIFSLTLIVIAIVL
jgi:hypothetical protein